MKCLVFITLFSVSAATTKIATPEGQILGSILTSRLNKPIYAFRGLRYAEPPTGELRFKPPVAAKKWIGIYNATADGPVCPQPSDDPVSEDCLFLNVYTTQVPVHKANQLRPVIVFIHAGGFYSGTGRSDWAGPQYFLDQDIVFVTINYRLASLGFLTLGSEAPGNNGLKDQVLAFKWIQSNIQYFGGDPNSVTLFGYSAGAWSASLHLVSPMSRGLFHKVILGSGSAYGQFVLPSEQIELARKQARFVGCDENASEEEILKCLKRVPAEDLGNSLDNFGEFDYDPIIIWYPVIEEDYGQERFLAEDPIKLIQRGDFANVPIVAGITQKEFGYKAFDYIINKTLLDELSQKFETFAPISFLYERGTNKSKEASAAIREFYFDEGPLTNDSFLGLNKLYDDSVIGFSVYRAVNLFSAWSSENVYYYQFTYNGRYSHFYLPGTNGTAWGAVHHDDLIYLLYVSALFPFFTKSDPEATMTEELTYLWASFAKTGNPNTAVRRLCKNLIWEAYNNSSRQYLDIGNIISIKEELYQDRYEFWNKLFPIST